MIGTIPAQSLFSSIKSVNLPKQLSDFSPMKRNDWELNNANSCKFGEAAVEAKYS